jgi:small subunit ribosomal protein S20
MPIIKSSIKDVRRIQRRTVRNRAIKGRLRTVIKSVLNATTREEAQNKLKLANKVIFQAKSKGILKKNTASRKMSRLSIQVQKIK